MDSGTGLTILGAALGSKDMVQKILGPTADYIGTGLAHWTENRVHNLARVFDIARKRLGENIQKPGAVPPKVLKGILEEAQFCDDELGAEYFGGVLASSRSEVSRDDRAASFISQIARLSTYQLRTHYIFYKVILSLFSGTVANMGLRKDCEKLRTFIPQVVYHKAMDFTPSEDLTVIVTHAMFGLWREALIDRPFYWGHQNHIKQHCEAISEPGILFVPSTLGVELFLWAHGLGNFSIRDFLVSPGVSTNFEIDLESGSFAAGPPKGLQISEL